MARVRDRTRQNVLEGLGWSIHRIWSTDWFRNPSGQMRKVVSAIERAKVRAKADSSGSASNGEPGAESASAETEGTGERSSNGEAAHKLSSEGAPADEPSAEDATNGEAPQERATTIERVEEDEGDLGALDYVKASLSVRLSGELHEAPTAQVGRWIREVVETESPVHVEVAMRRVMDAAGVSRMGRRVRETLEGGVSHAAREGWIVKSGDTLRKPGQDEIPVRDRSAIDGPARDIDHVPPAEIAAAARQITGVSFGITKEELVQQVGRRLGFQRVGSNIQERIGTVVDAMVEKRLLETDGEELSVAN
jgi:hypothetical protein